MLLDPIRVLFCDSSRLFRVVPLFTRGIGVRRMSSQHKNNTMVSNGMTAPWVPIVCGVFGGATVIAMFVLLFIFLIPRIPRGAGGEKWTPPTRDGGEEGDKGDKGACKHPRRIVMLKSDRCGHCKALLPVVEELKAKGVPIEIVDGPSTYRYAWYVKNNITGFPTICEIRGDKVTDVFTGRRTASSIEKYCIDRMQEEV